MPGSYPCSEVFFKIREGCILIFASYLWCRNVRKYFMVKPLQSMFLLVKSGNSIEKKRIETFVYVNEKKWIIIK